MLTRFVFHDMHHVLALSDVLKLVKFGFFPSKVFFLNQ